MCDLVMVRGNSTFGIEVKSDKDSPERLPGQLQELTKVFDYVIAFVTPHLAARITEQIPPECGLFTLENDKIKILQRPSKLDLDPVEIAYSIPSVYIKVRFNIPSELNVDELRKYTAQRYPRKLKEVYRDYLSKKYLTRFNLFKSERRHTTLVDDVTTLSIGEIIY